MAFVFLATQDAPRRHNEAVCHRHRSRLTNNKSVKASPNQPLKGDCASSAQREESPSQEERYYLTGDVIIDEGYHQDSEEVNSGDEDPFPLNDSTRISSYLSDDHLNEYCNNNNDHLININNSLSESNSRGIPIECLPPSLIKWPLDNNTKSKRIADIRQQVKLLSSIIKMTMDSDHAELAAGETKGYISPFSPNVNMAQIQDQIETSSGSIAPLPDILEISTLLQTGRVKEAKALIRESAWGVNHCIREALWKVLAQHTTNEQFSDSYYWESVNQVYGTQDMFECTVVLPGFIDQRQMATHSLSPEGVKSCNRLVAVVSYCFPGITYAPLIYSVAATFLHYMSEPEAFNCLAAMINNGSSYFAQTKILNESTWRTVLVLAKKHVRGSFFMLSKFGISEEQINEGFKDWSRWIFNHLPMSHLVRVVDCFLLEGSKVLLRSSLAIFHLFMRSTSRDSSLAASLSTKGFAEAIALFCQNINRSPTKLLKTAFGIRALSKSEIKKIVSQSEMVFKSQTNLGSTSGGHNGQSGVTSLSIDGLPNLESQQSIQMTSHTLDVKENSPRPYITLPNIKSSVVMQNELLLIWSWIPLRMTMQHPTLIYTTEEHGSSIRTFYNRVDQYEPTLLLVRTTNDYVFGAYCSAPWSERTRSDEYGNRQTYFGSGETFLFTLRPEPIRYEWVGIKKQRANSELRSVLHSEELYMHADPDMIAIGGGHGHGLMIDHEFQSGKTERCETFDNLPLCPDENFTIKVVEVYGLSQN